jgi:hypothetical protein
MRPDMGGELARHKVDDLYHHADAYRLTKPSRAARSAARRARLVELRAAAAQAWQKEHPVVPATGAGDPTAQGHGLTGWGHSIREAAHGLWMKRPALRRLH